MYTHAHLLSVHPSIYLLICLRVRESISAYMYSTNTPIYICMYQLGFVIHTERQSQLSCQGTSGGSSMAARRPAVGKNGSELTGGLEARIPREFLGNP